MRSVEPTVNELRASAEQNRTRLTNTVEALRTQVSATANHLTERLAPSAIKNDAVDYMRSSRDQLWHKVKTRARENPMETVAVGAAVAYPALKLLSAVPAPLMLIGAGIFLARASAKSSTQGSAAGRGQGTGHHTDAMEQVTGAARRLMHDSTDAMSDAVEASRKQVSDITTAVRGRLNDAADTATSGANEAIQEMKSQSSEALRQVRQKAMTSWEQHPLLIAGIGAAIGAIVAAALPATAAERAALGSANEALRRTTDSVAHKAVDAAQGAVERVSDAAGEQGLSVEGIDALAGSLGGKVKAVAEKGVAAAMSPSGQDQQASQLKPDIRS